MPIYCLFDFYFQCYPVITLFIPRTLITELNSMAATVVIVLKSEMLLSKCRSHICNSCITVVIVFKSEVLLSRYRSHIWK